MERKYKQYVVRRVITKSNPVFKKNSWKKTLLGILILLLMLISIYGTIYAYQNIRKKVQTLDFFNIVSVEILNSGKYLSENSIKEQTNLKLGSNIFTFSANKLEKKLKKLNPEIKDVRVKRRLPDIVKINIEERIPLGLLLYNGSFYCIDNEGIIFHKNENMSLDKLHLPIFTGVKISKEDIKEKKQNFSLLKGIQLVKKIKKYNAKFLENISEINLKDPFKILFITMEEGLEIKVGSSITKEKLAYLNSVISEIDTQKAKYIDIRFKDKVIVGY
ncbi:FtsQ-type POTRA domain-containing protein [Candidatus Desantisbacteria bacterium]|nr:FtsQ-type POTRA domain-containing protein [Candidatus Desantisbacteria bacterium]